jgi:hypothetical protein
MKALILYTLLTITFGDDVRIQQDIKSKEACDTAATVAKTGHTKEENDELDRKYAELKLEQEKVRQVIFKAEEERRKSEGSKGISAISIHGLMSPVYKPSDGESVVTIRGVSVVKYRWNVRDAFCIPQPSQK